MANKQLDSAFSPSINIIRDSNRSFDYIVTPNSRNSFNQIVNDYKIGTHSFNLVGAYGTGKSSFLLAFEQSLNQTYTHFEYPENSFGGVDSFKAIRIVGEYDSFLRTFAGILTDNQTDEVSSAFAITALKQLYTELSEQNQGLLILVDEFGKFLEYAAKNNPDSELYFIQQLAEFVNNPELNILFITTLHQDFNGYSRELSQSQQQEWDKVKGRLKEVTFNEPVEQLLFLASERLSTLKEKNTVKSLATVLKVIESSKLFPLKDYFNKDIAQKLLPFDLLSASVLTLALQKYGQNERSLFSFIESNDPLGIKGFDSSLLDYYHLGRVYDYLIHNYYSFLSTKYNPHYAQWAAIRSAIERVEGQLEDNVSDALVMVKTIGLVNVFGGSSGRMNDNFLNNYGKLCLGIKKPQQIIEQLSQSKIIRHVRHRDNYVLFEGTDLDIELAINDAGKLVERVVNITAHLEKYFEFPFVMAKAAYYQKGTPRYFAFNLCDTLDYGVPTNEVDGYINLIFSEELAEKNIEEVSKNCNDAVLFGYFTDTENIRNCLFEILKIEKVKEENFEDRVAVRELEKIHQHQIKLLNHYVIGNIYSRNSNIVWFYKGEKKVINDARSFNQLLSSICSDVYSKTPEFRNELVNKNKISGAISTARKNLLERMTEYWDQEDFGFTDDKFPPEKTIYLSLLRGTGIHQKTKTGLELGKPLDDSFQSIWQVGTQFLDDTIKGKRSVQELMDLYTKAPYKLKKGFAEFWLPIFLFVHRDNFALFDREGVYIPYLSSETLELIIRDPESFQIKAFDKDEIKLNLFNQYRSLIALGSEEKLSKQNFIQTIRPFLVFYKDLPDYTKRTNRLSSMSLAVRETIAHAKDPEDVFFEGFPKALGFDKAELQTSRAKLKEFITQLEDSIKEIRAAYSELANRFEQFILEDVVGEPMGFDQYKNSLQERFRTIKKHSLLPYQKVFYQRVMSELDDRNAWLNSLGQACIGKGLDVASDIDEELLYSKFASLVRELDNLCEISDSDYDENKEVVIKLEVTSFIEGLQRNLIRMPKSKSKKVLDLQRKLKEHLLVKDKQLKIVALVRLLEEELSNE